MEADCTASGWADLLSGKFMHVDSSPLHATHAAPLSLELSGVGVRWPDQLELVADLTCACGNGTSTGLRDLECHG